MTSEPTRGGGTIASFGSNAATVILVVCALAVTGMMAKRELGNSKPAKASRFIPQADWKAYAAGGNRIGPTDAKVVMVEFSDFQCPACQQLDIRLRETRKRFAQDFAIQYRHFPLSRHPFAIPAAIASECAAAQGRFEAMHAALFDRSDSIGVAPWSAFAEKAAVRDVAAFEKCMKDPDTDSIVQRDRSAAKQLGATATPTILVDGVRYSGTMSQTTLDSLVEQAIKKAGMSP